MSTERAPLRAVFFDLYNTLARFWPPREELQVTASRDLGVSVSPEMIARGYLLADAFMARVNAGPEPLRRRSPEARRAFFAEYEQLILRGAGVDVDLEAAGRIWDRLRQLPYALTLFDDVLPGMERLRALGLTLGLVTNMHRNGGDLLQEMGLAKALDLAVTSQEAGSEKPHAPIFRAALERAGVGPEEAAHVGDQYESDVLGAQAAGIQPVLMDRYGTAKLPRGIPVVHTMEELVQLSADWVKKPPRPHPSPGGSVPSEGVEKSPLP